MRPNIVNRLENTLDSLDDLISSYERNIIREEIEINGNKASVIIRDFESLPLLKNLRKILRIAHHFIKDIFKTKFIQNKYLKFFRLISEDCHKTSSHAAKRITQEYWGKKIPGKMLDNAKETIDKMIFEVNEIISFLNLKIKQRSDQIKEIPDINWVQKKARYAESKLFEEIEDESEKIEDLHKIENDYLNGNIDINKAIDLARKAWGKLGYQISRENAEMYLNYLK